MSTNLLIKTTFKNNLYLLRPFYKFHQAVWKPRRFVFIIGYTGTLEEETQKIEKIFPSYSLKKSESIGSVGKLARSMVLFKEGHLFFVLYKTDQNYDTTFTWDRLKGDIFRHINKYIDDGKFKRHLTVDNDDFHYVKDPEEAIKKDVVFFHSMEFIPGKEKPKKDSDFVFIGMRYFFRRKGCGGVVANSCSGCSVISWEKYNNVCHNSKHDKLKYNICKEKLKDFKNGISDKKLDDLDSFCFSFSCLSLSSLLKEKHWVSSIAKPTMRHSIGKDKIIDQFNKYYTLSEEEINSAICLKVNDFQRFF